MNRLHILDGHGYIFRAHYALMGSMDRRGVRLSNSEGMPTGALYVFTRMVIRMVKDFRPQRMAVVFDAPGPSFRKAIDPQYKANRSEAPEELTPQMPFFRQLTEAFAWPTVEVRGVEADDVIATMATRARERGWEVIIFSADKDMMQLVGNGVQVIDSMRQVTYTDEEVIKKFGVPPSQMADFLALIGDTSDNVPGMAGIGKVSAAKLLAEHGDIAGILAAAPTMKGKMAERFTDPVQLERLARSQQLIALRFDVELPTPLEGMLSGKRDIERLRALFTELEFGALLPELSIVEEELSLSDGDGAAAAEPGAAATAPDAAAAATAALPVEILADDAAIAGFAAAALAAGRLGLSLETDDREAGPRGAGARLVGLGLATTGRAPAYLPLAHRYLGCPPQPALAGQAALHELLAAPAVARVIHDSKSARRVLGAAGVALGDVAEDTLLAAFVLDPTKDAFQVERVLQGAVGAQLPVRRSLITTKGVGFEGVEIAVAADWSGRAAAAVLRAGDELGRRLKNAKLDALERDVELPVARILAGLEDAGVCIDVAHLRSLSGKVETQIAALEAQVRGLVPPATDGADTGPELNLGSPKQVAALLFDRLGLAGESDKMKKTKTGYSVDAEVLESLVDAHPIVAPILEHRELTKLKGTYLDALPAAIDPRTGRLHTIFNQAVAATGRISSQDPNLQNIPVRSELGRDIRRAFVAAPGRTLLAADYSQIELRILAHLCEDPLLVAAFRDGIDVHTTTAAEIFAVARDAVDAGQRRVAKAMNYGLAYGQSDFGLARALDVSRKQAKEYSDRYFERFPTVRAFMEAIVAQARSAGHAVTLLGRTRPIPDLRSKSPMARRAAERVAQNTPMQGSGADILKLAMIRCDAAMRAAGLGARMLLTVHDELVFEVEPAHAEALAALVKREMEHAYELRVPLVVDIGIGANWADC